MQAFLCHTRLPVELDMGNSSSSGEDVYVVNPYDVPHPQREPPSTPSSHHYETMESHDLGDPTVDVDPTVDIDPFAECEVASHLSIEGPRPAAYEPVSLQPSSSYVAATTAPPDPPPSPPGPSKRTRKKKVVLGGCTTTIMVSVSIVGAIAALIYVFWLVPAELSSSDGNYSNISSPSLTLATVTPTLHAHPLSLPPTHVPASPIPTPVTPLTRCLLAECSSPLANTTVEIDTFTNIISLCPILCEFAGGLFRVDNRGCNYSSPTFYCSCRPCTSWSSCTCPPAGVGYTCAGANRTCPLMTNSTRCDCTN